jgi:hypothetical protein
MSSILTSALLYEHQCGVRRDVAGSQLMSTAMNMEPKINFGDLTPYLTYADNTNFTFIFDTLIPSMLNCKEFV